MNGNFLSEVGQIHQNHQIFCNMYPVFPNFRPLFLYHLIQGSDICLLIFICENIQQKFFTFISLHQLVNSSMNVHIAAVYHQQYSFTCKILKFVSVSRNVLLDDIFLFLPRQLKLFIFFKTQHNQLFNFSYLKSYWVS